MDSSEVIAAITERVKDTAHVSAVFGDPYETTSGLVIIPVASVKIAGGGGGGGQGMRSDETDTGNSGSGIGLGVRVMAMPLGYIEVKPDGTARFVTITDNTKIAVGGAVVLSLFLLTVTRAMRRMAWKRHMRQSWRRQET